MRQHYVRPCFTSNVNQRAECVIGFRMYFFVSDASQAEQRIPPRWAAAPVLDGTVHGWFPLARRRHDVYWLAAVSTHRPKIVFDIFFAAPLMASRYTLRPRKSSPRETRRHRFRADALFPAFGFAATHDAVPATKRFSTTYSTGRSARESKPARRIRENPPLVCDAGRVMTRATCTHSSPPRVGHGFCGESSRA
jgi:hypothetical protein